MELSASVRFAGALAASERAVVTRTLRSAGATVTSWNDAGDRTYALLAIAPSATERTIAAAVPGASVAVPARAVLRVTPTAARMDAVADALTGAAAPRGIVASAREADAVIVEVDLEVTPLAAIVARVDVETRGDARRIDLVLPLADDALARFAGALLADPAIDASRMIETHLEPLLARGRT